MKIHFEAMNYRARFVKINFTCSASLFQNFVNGFDRIRGIRIIMKIAQTCKI